MPALSPNDGKIKWGFQYIPNDPYDFDEISEHPIINAKVNGEDRKLVVHAARNGFFYALDRTNGSFIAGKQYVDQLNTDARPRSEDGPPAQLQPGCRRPDLCGGQPRHPRPAKQRQALSGAHRRQELGALRLQSRARPAYIPRSKAAITSRRSSRRTRGPGRNREAARALQRRRHQDQERLYGSLKAVDPVTGDIKAALKLTYPNYSGALATAGNLVFIGNPDGTFSAHDAKSLQELWSFNVGTGINAPPITYSVNGNQYVAVLVGSRQSQNVIPYSPELKNTSTASMLFVFSL